MQTNTPLRNVHSTPSYDLFISKFKAIRQFIPFHRLLEVWRHPKATSILSVINLSGLNVLCSWSMIELRCGFKRLVIAFATILDMVLHRLIGGYSLTVALPTTPNSLEKIQREIYLVPMLSRWIWKIKLHELHQKYMVHLRSVSYKSWSGFPNQ